MLGALKDFTHGEQGFFNSFCLGVGVGGGGGGNEYTFKGAVSVNMFSFSSNNDCMRRKLQQEVPNAVAFC